MCDDLHMPPSRRSDGAGHEGEQDRVSGGTEDLAGKKAVDAERIVDLERKVDTLLSVIRSNSSMLKALAARDGSTQEQRRVHRLALTGLAGNDAPDSPDQVAYRKARAQSARERIRERRYRDRIFSPDFFADPAWDILLDLYAAHYEGQQVSVSSLCIAASVPSTTALRWIRTMSDAGFLERSRDDADGRRVFIRLSEDALQKLDQYFDALRD